MGDSASPPARVMFHLAAPRGFFARQRSASSLACLPALGATRRVSLCPSRAAWAGGMTWTEGALRRSSFQALEYIQAVLAVEFGASGSVFVPWPDPPGQAGCLGGVSFHVPRV